MIITNKIIAELDEKSSFLACPFCDAKQVVITDLTPYTEDNGKKWFIKLDLTCFNGHTFITHWENIGCNMGWSE